MRGSRLLAGHEVAATRPFAWTSVIEWQAGPLRQPRRARVSRRRSGSTRRCRGTFVGELLQSRAAAICVSLHPSGPVRRVPRAAARRGRRSRRAGDRPAVGDRLRRRQPLGHGRAAAQAPAPAAPDAAGALASPTSCSEGGGPDDVAAAVETWAHPVRARLRRHDAPDRPRARGRSGRSTRTRSPTCGSGPHSSPRGLPRRSPTASITTSPTTIPGSRSWASRWNGRRRGRAQGLMGFVYVLDDADSAGSLTAVDRAALGRRRT